MSFSVRDALDKYVADLEVPRPPDGKWHPSAIFGCARQAVYGQLGTEPSDPIDARTKRLFRVGHILHDFTEKAVLRSEDIEEAYTEVGVALPGLNVSGHFDALVKYSTGTWEVIEFKTISSRAFGYADLPKPDHVNQVSVYLMALREHGATSGDTIIPPLGEDLRRARIVYISKDDLRVEEYTILWSPGKEADIRDRVAILAGAIESGSLPARLPLTPAKTGAALKRAWQCGYCQYATTCWQGE